MFNQYIASIIIVFGVLSAGCSSSSMLDQNWGRSAETARFNQIIDPDAGSDNRPVEGMDGQSALNTFYGYRDAFKQQEADTGYDITVTGLSEKK
jgi:hypothetical protein